MRIDARSSTLLATLIYGASCMYAGSADAQSRIKIVVPDRAVEIGAGSFPVIEPSLAVNPRDARHLLGAMIVEKKSDISEADCASIVSFDAGTTWARHDFGLKNCADPYVMFNADGRAVITLLDADSSGGT